MAARLATTNLLAASGVTITSSGEASGYFDDYAATLHRWKKWRSSTSTGDQWIKFDCGANKTFTFIAAVSALIHAGGTLKFQAHTSDSWATPNVDQLVTVPSPDFTAVWTYFRASTSQRWFRFYFTNTGAVSSYVELAVAWAGTYLEPSASVAPGLTVRRVDPSPQRRAIGGQRLAVRRSKYHEVNGIWRSQVGSARDDIRTAFETSGGTEPVIFAVESGTPSLIFYGPVEAQLEMAHREQSTDLWAIPFRVTEDVP
jgi:hypothetical protein